MENRKVIYVAGKLNADAVGYIQNMHQMIVWARQVRKAGFSVYVPCNDFLEGLVDGKFEYPDYFDNSQPILAKCDGVFVCPNSEASKGTQREIVYAKMLTIPVFDSLSTMVDYFKE